MSQHQFDQVVSLPDQQRCEHFIAKVTDWEELWTLKVPDGFVLFGDDSGWQCACLAASRLRSSIGKVFLVRLLPGTA